MSIWLTIIGMALATYATRVTLLLALRGEIVPWLRRWLGFVPVAVFTALILPELLVRANGVGTTFALGPPLPAGMVAALVSWRTGSVPLTIIAGLATFWAARWLGF